MRCSASLQSSCRRAGKEFFRMTEKTQKTENLLPKISDRTLAQKLSLPWESFTLQRPMKLFKGSLGLEPGVSAAPDPEFLVRLTTGHPSHQALIRTGLGPKQYKNLENVIRGHNKPTAKTWESLMEAMNVSDEVLRKMANGQKDGPLIPELLAVFQMLEGMVVQLYAGITSVEVNCPHCGHNAMDDIELYWHRQSVTLEDSAYRFVERLLSAIVGAHLIKDFFNSLSKKEPSDEWLPSQLCHPDHHPIGNWLEIVRRSYGAESLLSLTMMHPFERKKGVQTSYERILKWSSGADPMPPEAAVNLIENIPNTNASSIKNLLIVARTFALAIDVISATAKEEEPSRDAVQRIVFERMCDLEKKYVVALSQSRKNLVDRTV
jgi:hypothetical protein